MADRAWIEPLARTGFAVKGVVYLLLGWLAVQVALGLGGRLTSIQGAMASVISQPFGRVLIAAIAAGLAMYAGWRFLEAFADANRLGTDRGALAERALSAVSGAVYAVLAFDAGRMASAGGAASGSEVPRTLLASPLAPWLLVLVALGLIAYGVMQMRKAFSRKLSDNLNVHQVSREAGALVVRISRIGIAARAILLVTMGVLLFRGWRAPAAAATQTDAGESLRLLSALPSGRWLMAFVAAGLMAYGVFQLVHARYRRITPP